MNTYSLDELYDLGIRFHPRQVEELANPGTYDFWAVPWYVPDPTDALGGPWQLRTSQGGEAEVIWPRTIGRAIEGWESYTAEMAEMQYGPEWRIFPTVQGGSDHVACDAYGCETDGEVVVVGAWAAMPVTIDEADILQHATYMLLNSGYWIPLNEWYHWDDRHDSVEYLLKLASEPEPDLDVVTEEELNRYLHNVDYAQHSLYERQAILEELDCVTEDPATELNLLLDSFLPMLPTDIGELWNGLLEYTAENARKLHALFPQHRNLVEWMSQW